MIHGKRTEGLAAELSVRNHRIVAGLPPKLGGNDEGPDPHELLEMALAACSILTAQLYAERKGFPLTSTEVNVKITAEGAESRILRELRFQGDLSDEQRARLTEIVQRCPVHKLLESHIKIETVAKA